MLESGDNKSDSSRVLSCSVCRSQDSRGGKVQQIAAFDISVGKECIAISYANPGRFRGSARICRRKMQVVGSSMNETRSTHQVHTVV